MGQPGTCLLRGAWPGCLALAQCADGTYDDQPNRDNAGYDSDARMTASSVTAFILLVPKRSLVMTGRPADQAGPAASEAARSAP